MKKLKNKRYTISLLVTVLGLIGLISGTSYAILKGSTNATNEQVIKTGSVELKLTENFHGINVGVPTMSDVDGLLQDDVYNFTVTNIGTVSAKYDLKLINEAPSGQTALSSEYVRLGLEVNGQEMGPMGLTNVNSIIDSNTIAEGEIVRYKLRLWFDNSKTSELTGNTDKVYLKLKVEAKQAEYKEPQPEPGATVLYTDGTLIINEPSSQRQENITKHGAVTNEYTEMKKDGTDIEKYIFTSAADQPWANERGSITKVEIGQKIYPTSTAYWFHQLLNMTTGDFTNLNTSRVTDMSYMFQNAGTNSAVTSFTLTGLNKWDTSNVTTMESMFTNAAFTTSTLKLDVSDWNTSNVTNMNSLFRNFGGVATTFSIGNISGWNTSKVTDMGHMLHGLGGTTTSFNIGNISGWDVSKVTNMEAMFRDIGRYSINHTLGNLSTWDVSKVTNMNYMFYGAGKYSSNFSLNLSNWNVSNVTDMSYMFQSAGSNSAVTSFKLTGLDDWDT